jgi:cytidyltransferase-like protein
MNEPHVVVSGRFDNLQASDVRFLEEAASFGPVHVLLWSDAAIRRLDGRQPRFPEAERLYLLNAIRYVDQVTVWRDDVDIDSVKVPEGVQAAAWVVESTADNAAKRAFCQARGLDYHVLPPEVVQDFHLHSDEALSHSSAKRVLVTGCYDWFHSGHVRFFEEVAELGDLYVVVGHDANIRLLKGEGHPMFSEQQRRYFVQSIRHVKRAMISSGEGWLDAEPEIIAIKPHIYAVNEDGDRLEKRQYCDAHDIEYRVLKRLPKQGLPRRQSTDLRGF